MPDAPQGTGVVTRLVSVVCNKMYPFLCLGILLSLTRNPCQNLSSTVTLREPDLHIHWSCLQKHTGTKLIKERLLSGKDKRREDMDMEWMNDKPHLFPKLAKEGKKKGEKSHRLVTTFSTLHDYQHHVFILHMLGVRSVQPWHLNTCTCTTSPFISFICRTVIRAENTLALVFSIICWSACSTPSRICVKEFMILSTELNSLTTKRESSSD